MQRIVHVVFTTHWDCEWIQSFVQYSYRLVRLVDKLLAILELY
jgi:alpha-mannosidase